MNVISPDPQRLHPLEVVIRMTGSTRRKIIFYCSKGIVAPLTVRDEWYFDEESVKRLRHVEMLRQQHRMNWAAIHTIVSLLNEVESLRDELRFLR